MKAAFIIATGKPDILKYGVLPMPAPKAGEILVRVNAACVNPLDTYLRAGMVQTGIPFGAISAVRDWMRLRGKVGVPTHAHPQRPVTGFACPRTEVSGRRLWDWAAQRFGSAEQFFARFFVANYCPLAFMEESGKNRTPDALPPGERAPLFAACDAALRKVVQQMRPSWVVGIGAFAEGRCLAALQGLPVQVGRVLHPSPQSPQANRGWSTAAEAQLRAMGIAL